MTRVYYNSDLSSEIGFKTLFGYIPKKNSVWLHNRKNQNLEVHFCVVGYMRAEGRRASVDCGPHNGLSNDVFIPAYYTF